MLQLWRGRLVGEKTVKNATRPAIFKWRQTASELILCAVRWYLRYSLSLRDVEELLAGRGLEARRSAGLHQGLWWRMWWRRRHSDWGGRCER